MSIFNCNAYHERFSGGDYWCSTESLTTVLTGSSLSEIYERIAQYKMQYEVVQAPRVQYDNKYEYLNFNDYTKVYFGPISEVVEVYPTLEIYIRGSDSWSTAVEIQKSIDVDEAMRRHQSAVKGAATKAAKQKELIALSDRRRQALERMTKRSK